MRSNNRDLQLILAFMEKDAAHLQNDFDSERTANHSLKSQARALIYDNMQLQGRVEELEELLDLRGTVGIPQTLLLMRAILNTYSYVI